MNKKLVIILGATCELGKELSKVYANNDYNLILISRNFTKNNELKDKLLSQFPKIEVKTY